MRNVRVSIIAAIDEKRGLGKNNDLLFRIKEDGKRVRNLTTGHPLIMGRKTFESLGRLLPNRSHIVVTRDPESLKHLSYQPDVVVGSLEEGIEAGKRIEQEKMSSPTRSGIQKIDSRLRGNDSNSEVFIFGGGQIYTQAIEKDLVDRLYLTVVKGDYDADTFFPDYSMFTKVLNKEEHESEGYEFTFLDLKK